MTGLKYYAWKMGPVPTELYEELDDPAEDMRSNVEITQATYKDFSGKEKYQVSIKPLSQFDRSFFSKRELRLMERIATQYQSQRAEEMIEATHAPGLPWYKRYEEEGCKQGEIPYSYILSEEDRDLMKELATERSEMIENYA